METRSKSRQTSDDRFSSLPIDLAYKIVSFLSIEDIARLSVVSKSCRELCISTPSLPFDVTPYRDDSTKRAKLMNFIERLLLLRKEMDTEDFHIRWCLESSLRYGREEYRVFSWLSNALRSKVKQLVLDVTLEHGSDFALPSTMLHCKSLEAVTMIFSNGTGILKIPPSVGGAYGFSSLRCLRMRSVLVDKCFGKWVSSHCKFMIEVSLTKIRGVKSITIASSSLKILHIKYADDLVRLNVSAKELAELYLAFNSVKKKRELKLSAPNLKIFRFYVRSKMKFKPFYDKNLVPVLRDVAGNLKRLALDEDSILELLKLRLSIQFRELDELFIWIKVASDDLVPIVASFLAGTQNLRVLTISFFPPANANGEKDDGVRGRWESQDVSVLKNLKFVTLELMDQRENELELITYFLESAEDLQKMTVYYGPPLLAHFLKKIIQFQRASSNAKLEFLPIKSEPLL